MFEHDRTVPIISSGFFDDAHNLFLELGASGGWPLAIFFFGLIAWAAVLATLKCRSELLPEASALLGALAAWTCSSMFTPVSTACYTELALLLAACFVLFRYHSGSFVEISGWLKKIVMLLGAIFLVGGILFASAELLFFSGIQAYNNNQFGKAYSETTLAIRLNPTNKLYYVYRSGSAILDGLPLLQANELMASMNRLNPRRALSYIQTANLDYLLLYRTNNPVYKQQVIENLQKAIQLDKFFPDNYYLLAQYQLVFENLPAAYSATQSGLAINPTDEGWLLEAKIYQLENNRAGLLDALKRAYESQGNDPEFVRLWHLAQTTSDLRNLPLNLTFNLGQLN
jgi:tetratricopeptide (TPR) repeat protein